MRSLGATARNPRRPSAEPKTALEPRGTYSSNTVVIHDTNHPCSTKKYATADSTVSTWLGLISAVQHTHLWYHGFIYSRLLRAVVVSSQPQLQIKQLMGWAGVMKPPKTPKPTARHHMTLIIHVTCTCNCHTLTVQPVEGRASAEHRDRQRTSSQTAPSTTVCLARHSRHRRMTWNAAAPHLTHSGSPGRSEQQTHRPGIYTGILSRRGGDDGAGLSFFPNLHHIIIINTKWQ